MFGMFAACSNLETAESGLLALPAAVDLGTFVPASTTELSGQVTLSNAGRLAARWGEVTVEGPGSEWLTVDDVQVARLAPGEVVDLVVRLADVPLAEQGLYEPGQRRAE